MGKIACVEGGYCVETWVGWELDAVYRRAGEVRVTDALTESTSDRCTASVTDLSLPWVALTFTLETLDS